MIGMRKQTHQKSTFLENNLKFLIKTILMWHQKLGSKEVFNEILKPGNG